MLSDENQNTRKSGDIQLILRAFVYLNLAAAVGGASADNPFADDSRNPRAAFIKQKGEAELDEPQLDGKVKSLFRF